MDRKEFLERAGGIALGASAVGAFSGFRLDSLAGGPYGRLAREIAGSVLTPSSSGYAQRKRLYNPRFSHSHPHAIVYCESVDDVAKTVRWARKHAIRIVARCGGHSYGGYSTTSSGVVVDVSRMHGVHAHGGVATVGAGAKLIDIYATLARHGETIPGGSCPTVGIAGLALGGGVGYAGRKLGLTCDTITGLSLVTARGELLECNPHEHADLFWACRGGGGGNFGIVTSFHFRTHAVRDVAYYEMRWPWTNAAEAVRAWQEFAPHAPDALFSDLFLATTAPKGPGTVPTIGSGGQFFGTQSELSRLIAPLANVGSPTTVAVGTLSYTDAIERWAGCHPFSQCHTSGGIAFKGKSDYVGNRLSSGGISTLLGGLETNQTDVSLGGAELIFDAYGGAINRVDRDETAFVHRDAAYSIQYGALWSGDGSADLRWIDELYAAMRPFVSGHAYQNYIDPALRTWRHAYYGSNFKRLVAVKRKHDPHDVFHFEQSIPVR